MHIIYKTTYIPTGKIYIGKHKIQNLKTLDPWYVGSGVEISKIIQADKKKFGHNWIHLYKREILAKIKNDDLNKVGRVEVFFIKKFDSTNPSIGYNLIEEISILDLHIITPEIRKKISNTLKKKYRENPECHSQLGRHHSEYTKQLISKATSGENNPFFGRKHTDETKEKIRQSRLGKSVSLKTKQRVSETHKGVKWSEDRKEKLSQTTTGRRSITNGERNSWLLEGQDLPEGWRFGRLPYKVKRVFKKKSALK